MPKTHFYVIINNMVTSALNPLEVRDRPIIVEGSPILGGVLLSRVGIVVDVDENPQPYRAAMEATQLRIDQIAELGNPLTNSAILYAVDRAARKYAPYSPVSYINALQIEAQLRGKNRLDVVDRVGLSTFIAEGGREYFDLPIGGTCQHYSLLSGALIELLQQAGVLGGSVTIQSTRPNAYHPDRHTRTVFVDASERFFLDIVSGVHQDSSFVPQ